jgi:scyllo-inositol 2-dehydrogenase (NADP+)
MEKIKTGVLGYGFSGRIFQCPFIESNDHFELTAIVQRNGSEAKEDYPGTIQYREYEDMLRNQDIELVIVATPAHLHFEHAMKALDAKKHVLIEKPFASTKKEAKALVEKANEVGRIVTVYHNRRFDGDFLTIKKLLEEGTKVYEYEAVWDRDALVVDEKDWHEQGFVGSDLLYDLGPHFLDQALHLFGEPESIYGIAKTLRPNSKIIDYFSIELNYKDKVVRLKSCMHAAKQDVRYKIHTDKGTYYFYKMDEQENQLLAGIRPLDKSYGDIEKYDLFDWDGNKISKTKIKGDYTAYFDMLASAIRNKGPLPVSTLDAVKVIGYLEEVAKGKLK